MGQSDSKEGHSRYIIASCGDGIIDVSFNGIELLNIVGVKIDGDYLTLIIKPDAFMIKTSETEILSSPRGNITIYPGIMNRKEGE